MSKKSAKKKKSPVMRRVLVILISLLAVAAVVYAVKSLNNEQMLFDPNKRKQAEKLYDNIMFEEYPGTAEALMDVYADTVMLLYGGMIIDDGVFDEVLNKQRELLSAELLDLNSFESQREQLVSVLDGFGEQGILLSSIEVKSFTRVSGTEYTAVVTENFNRMIPYKLTFTLIKENEKWKIYSFY